MPARRMTPSLLCMKRRLLFLLLVTGLLLLALGGWTVQGLRWALSAGWARSGAAPQPA
jgi:hypothetical protein